VTERLVKAVSEDIVKVVVDYGMEKSKKARKDIDTGAFKKIYKGKYVEENSGTVGLALVCEGIAMKKKKNNTAKVTTLKPNFPPASWDFTFIIHIHTDFDFKNTNYLHEFTGIVYNFVYV